MGKWRVCDGFFVLLYCEREFVGWYAEQESCGLTFLSTNKEHVFMTLFANMMIHLYFSVLIESCSLALCCLAVSRLALILLPSRSQFHGFSYLLFLILPF
jgi:hypothetical protein